MKQFEYDSLCRILKRGFPGKEVFYSRSTHTVGVNLDEHEEAVEGCRFLRDLDSVLNTTLFWGIENVTPLLLNIRIGIPCLSLDELADINDWETL